MQRLRRLLWDCRYRIADPHQADLAEGDVAAVHEATVQAVAVVDLPIWRAGELPEALKLDLFEETQRLACDVSRLTKVPRPRDIPALADDPSPLAMALSQRDAAGIALWERAAALQSYAANVHELQRRHESLRQGLVAVSDFDTSDRLLAQLQQAQAPRSVHPPEDVQARGTLLEVTNPDDVDELATLRGRRQAVRRQVADAVVDHGQRSQEVVELRQVLRDVTAGCADLIRQAAAVGHPLADVARAAGVAAPSLYYRLRQPVLEQPG